MKTRDWIAVLVMAALGLPALFVAGAAFARGETRRREAPLRALLGNEAFEALSAGQEYSQHYLGEDRRAPSFTLRQPNGDPWSLEEHRGKVIVLNFWTTTCQPCVEEMPSLIELGRMVSGRDDIELVLVSADPDWQTAQTVLSASAPLTMLIDPEREVIQNAFGTRLYPETWVIDPQGVIRLRIDGQRNWNQSIVLEALESFR